MRRLYIIGGLTALVIFSFWIMRDRTAGVSSWTTQLIEARGTAEGSLYYSSPLFFFLAGNAVDAKTDTTEVWALVGIQTSRLGDGRVELALLKVLEVGR